MSNKRFVCRANDDEWSTAASCKFGNSCWFVVGDDENNVTGPLSPLQVQQWFTTGWLQEYLMNAGHAAEESYLEDSFDHLRGNDLAHNEDTADRVAEWFYLDDDMVSQGPFTKQDMMDWFRSGAWHRDRCVAQGDGDWEEAHTVRCTIRR